VKDPLDVHAMRAAARFFLGLKDFRSFSAGEPEDGSTKVKVDRVEVAESGDLILIRVMGSHFLWKMVRRMVGVMVEVGRGEIATGEVVAFLGEKHSRPAESTAPPSGLFLERVFYDGDVLDHPLQPVFFVASARG
jgi:tRNA pseudouridine38-40 synthase